MRKWIKAIIASALIVGGAGALIWQQFHDQSYHPEGSAPAEFLKPFATSKSPLSRPASFFLNTIPKTKVPELSPAEWERAFPLFHHAPFESSRFNAVSLPWKYETNGGAEADPNVALSVAFLLSFDLDWSPESYSGRHAYFVFKNVGDLIRNVDKAYQPQNLAALVTGWNATHAIGGTLTKTPAGYAATLRIFDAAGALVHEKTFDQPSEFFQMMGDVSCDALAFFKSPPNDLLAKHLHRRRCERAESLSKLGAAAFSEWCSPEEFAIYADILKQDPTFSEVRQWRGNQQFHWTEGRESAYADDEAIALASAVNINPLVDFKPELCTRKDLTARL